jgi:hypothetical protein
VELNLAAGGNRLLKLLEDDRLDEATRLYETLVSLNDRSEQAGHILVSCATQIAGAELRRGGLDEARSKITRAATLTRNCHDVQTLKCFPQMLIAAIDAGVNEDCLATFVEDLLSMPAIRANAALLNWILVGAQGLALKLTNAAALRCFEAFQSVCQEHRNEQEL